jgi:hypothetical protein
MPDWFYRTVAQRALFFLPDEAGRAVALGVIGTLGKSAPGRAVIEFMGHMAPEPRLAVTVAGTRYASPIGLGWRVDPECRASAGLACFGVGCLEATDANRRQVRREAGETLEDGLVHPEPPQVGTIRLPVLKRHWDLNGHEWLRLPDGTNLSVLAWDHATETERPGVVLQVGMHNADGGWSVPAKMPATLPEKVRAWRTALPEGAPLIVAGGIGSPGDAVALVQAGADLLLVDAGMVYRGPGLVKRCNEALLARLPAPPEAAVGLFRRAWFWTAILGAAMGVGGAATLALSLTRVLLPYDEHYLGLTAPALERTMPTLFAFMAHDRATLAGVMLGLGWLYWCLGRGGIRAGRHGAQTAVIASALVGFASFFAFFGFGYFDSLHAFVAVVLLQFTVQIMVSVPGGGEHPPVPVDEEDAAWRRAQWGQLLWVVHAVGLLFAGGLILGIGMTSVFVAEDLGFLCMTAEQVQALGERLMGVVAHDRATLGGMLLATGTAMLLPVLWCFRRGEAWLWRAMAGLGLPAYVAAIGIHYHVGYTDWRHLVPAWIGLGLWVAGLGLSRGYLRAR